MYKDASTYDGVDLSDMLLPGALFVNIVSWFPYLGKKIARMVATCPTWTAASSQLVRPSAC
jgi:hypothetical protein